MRVLCRNLSSGLLRLLPPTSDATMAADSELWREAGGAQRRRSLKELMEVEKVDENVYRSQTLNVFPTSKIVFGGHLIGQALVAASRTVPCHQYTSSLHGYFLRGGLPDIPAFYRVNCVRDGRTYSSRSVSVVQSEQVIFTLQASFKSKEYDSYSHQWSMPAAPPPQQLLNIKDLISCRLSHPDTTEEEKCYLKKLAFTHDPIEFKPVEPEQFLRTVPQKPKRLFWFRALGHIGEDTNMHDSIIAYISDYHLITTTLLPGARNVKFNHLTSLDHSMWFHNPLSANDWLLYETESPQCGNGKGFVTGRIWRQDGTLAISVAQEAVVRSKM